MKFRTTSCEIQKLSFLRRKRYEYFSDRRCRIYRKPHLCRTFENGYDVVVVDNLSNSCEKSLERVKEITGKEVTFYKGDILDRDFLESVFEKENIASLYSFCRFKKQLVSR